MKLPAALFVAGTLALSLTGCNTAPKPAPTQAQPDESSTPFKAPPAKPSPPKTGLTVKSDAFADGKPIPEQFTCKGDGDPPPLTWSGTVAGAKNLAVVVNDPDAPNGGYLHWIHHYHFTVYALDGPAGVPDGAPPQDAIAAIKGHYIAFGELIGTVAA
ncbi:MAG: hypothetical protein AUI14_15445 [Actinobacteria bacterium 13_2_20CM_2_71_6]|nr:MAG: hypothetical protein AUI14_15445 [Actinobacteria bacterium 13_2_20CM_2_71_6]